MKDAIISVVIPVYNVQQYLKKCVDSILEQTIQNYEIILVDDGSSDECPRICDEYAEANDNVMSLHKKKRRFIGCQKFWRTTCHGRLYSLY